MEYILKWSLQNCGGEIIKNKNYGNLYLSEAVPSVERGFGACRFG